jgi:hypothetical protein
LQASLDPRERRIEADVHVRASRVRELRDEADVGERRRVAMAERPVVGSLGELRLQRLQALVDPVRVPRFFCSSDTFSSWTR